MKITPLRSPLATVVALLSLAGLAQAHPGHSVLDWYSYLPHPGHENEYATILLALALLGVVYGACWAASRRR